MPPSNDIVAATWIGPAGCKLNGQELVPGETTVEIPAGEAFDSDNWQPPRGAKAPKTPDPEPAAAPAAPEKGD